MSKIMIASDIHGSAYYCRQMLERFKEEKAERLVLLGDILYHGPRNDLPKEYAPKEVIAMLNPLRNRIICVRGNCDTDILLCGHTHVPKCEKRDGYIYMNPGSVSIPKENSAHSYMILEDRFYWKDIEDGSTYMNY